MLLDNCFSWSNKVNYCIFLGIKLAFLVINIT